MQKGDVHKTHADITKLKNKIGIKTILHWKKA